jgi:hypothetical protein
MRQIGGRASLGASGCTVGFDLVKGVASATPSIESDVLDLFRRQFRVISVLHRPY